MRAGNNECMWKCDRGNGEWGKPVSVGRSIRCRRPTGRIRAFRAAGYWKWGLKRLLRAIGDVTRWQMCAAACRHVRGWQRFEAASARRAVCFTSHCGQLFAIASFNKHE